MKGQRHKRRAAAWAGLGVALGTLAWPGPAAVTEGTAGTIHRLADGLHLLAAGAWLGALAVLVTLLFAHIEDERSVAAARSALAGFAVAGSIIVASIVTTGLINVWMIVGVEGALRRRKIDYIDLYQTHWPDRTVPFNRTR